jgi:hypothetical protein
MRGAGSTKVERWGVRVEATDEAEASPGGGEELMLREMGLSLNYITMV